MLTRETQIIIMKHTFPITSKFINIFFLLWTAVTQSLGAQTYTVTSQGKNYGNGGAYVAPIVTKTYTVKSPIYSAPASNTNYNSSSRPSTYTLSSTNVYTADNSSRSSTASVENRVATTANDFCDLGNYKYMDKNYNEAIRYYSKAIALDPRNKTYYLCVGRSKYMLKDYQGAVEQDHTTCFKS